MKDESTLPEDVQRLIEAERSAPGPSGAARIEEGIARRLALEPAPRSRRAWFRPRRTWLAASLWWLPALALGLGTVAGAVGQRWRDRRTPASPTPIPSIAPRPGPDQPTEPPPRVTPSVGALQEPPHPAGVRHREQSADKPSGGKVAPKPVEPVDAERLLIDQARTALDRGSIEEALGALEDCARRFPNGELAEEREVLWIQAANRAGRKSEARERAAAFAAQHPESLFLPWIGGLHGDAG